MSEFLHHLISKKTLTLRMLILGSLLFSFYSYNQIRMEVMPAENVPAFLFVRVNHFEESEPEKIEAALTQKVESSLRTIPKIKKMSTNTNSRGVSVSLFLEPGTNLDMTSVLIAEAFQTLAAQKVLIMKNVSFSKLNPEANSVIKLSLISKSGSPAGWNRTLQELQSEIEAWPEVSKVEIQGLDLVRYRYTLPYSKLQSLNVPPSQIGSMVSNTDYTEGIGQTPEGSFSLNKPITARIKAEDFSTLVERPFRRSNPWTLSQLGEPEKLDRSKEEWNRVDTEPAVFFEVFAREQADLFRLAERLNNKLKLEKKYNLKMEVILNRITDLKSALSDVFDNLFQALITTFLIVGLFYRNFRKTVIISASIPFTLIVTVAIMYLFGASLNIISLSGLILGIGMVVDNAILVLETIDEKKKTNIFLASAQGAIEVLLPLGLSTITNAIIFLPVAFIDTDDSFTQLLKSLQIPIISSLLASLFVALIYLPAITQIWPSKRQSQEFLGKKETSEAWIWSEPFFKKCLDWKWPILIVSASLLGWLSFLVLNLESADLETAPDPYIQVIVRYTAEVSVAEKKLSYGKLENSLVKLKNDGKLRLLIAEFNPQYSSGSFTLFPNFSEDRDQERSHLEDTLKSWINDQVPVPGMHLSLGWDTWGGGGRGKMISFNLSGANSKRLNYIIEDLSSKLRKVPGVMVVRNEAEEMGKPELIWKLSESSPLKGSEVARELSSLASIKSITVSKGKESDVQLQLQILPDTQGSEMPKEWTYEGLAQATLQVDPQKRFRLADQSGPRSSSTRNSISRKSQTSTQRLYVFFDEHLGKKELDAAMASARAEFNKFDFPPGYSVPVDDQSAQNIAMQKKTNFIIALSTFLIFLILASMFESILVPFGMMLTVPLALITGAAGLLPFSLDLDVMARLALVILVGVAVNNAIILIDLMRTLKFQGLARRQSIVKACSQRLKSVVLTTLIQVVSVFPVALGKSKLMGIPYASLGIVIISGMLLSTIVTLIILPAIYETTDSLEDSLKAPETALVGPKF